MKAIQNTANTLENIKGGFLVLKPIAKMSVAGFLDTFRATLTINDGTYTGCEADYGACFYLINTDVTVTSTSDAIAGPTFESNIAGEVGEDAEEGGSVFYLDNPNSFSSTSATYKANTGNAVKIIDP